MRKRIVIVDSGGANIASLDNALERLGASCELSSDPGTIRSATHVILPGVGAAADAMKKLRRTGVVDTLKSMTKPVLGICLGMHLLAERSEEDHSACLGIIPGTAKRLHATPHSPVPHTGWSQIRLRGQHPLLRGLNDESYFYFVHSYALPIADYTIATVDHGEPFSAIIAAGNFHATQFHPERSSEAGSKLLENFIRL